MPTDRAQGKVRNLINKVQWARLLRGFVSLLPVTVGFFLSYQAGLAVPCPVLTSERIAWGAIHTVGV